MSKDEKQGPNFVKPEYRRTSSESNLPLYPSPDARAKLEDWLKDQLKKLKSLDAKEKSLRLDFVRLAKERGEILLEASQRLAVIPGRFHVWVCQDAKIGYSTALFWIDVVKNWDVVEPLLSNPLEPTLRQIRDAIRDARQKRGEGKPGAGRRKRPPAETPTEDDNETGDAADEVESSDEDVAPDNSRWEKAAAEAEAEAAQVDGGETKQPKQLIYKVVVTVASEGDQANLQNALSHWSPISIMPIGSKQVRSVSAHVRPDDIGMALQRLGKALEANPPKAVKVSVEL